MVQTETFDGLLSFIQPNDGYLVEAYADEMTPVTFLLHNFSQYSTICKFIPPPLLTARSHEEDNVLLYISVYPLKNTTSLWRPDTRFLQNTVD